MTRFQFKQPPAGISTGVIAVDVDNTLVTGGRLNRGLVEWLRRAKDDGKTLLLWSSRGGAYARNVAEHHGIDALFDVVIGKPETAIDDDGWSWTRFSKTIPPTIFTEPYGD